VLAGLGGEHGRLVAEFPSGWSKRVLEAAKRVGVASLQQARLSRRLQLIRHAVVDMRRTYDDDSAWFTNATRCTPPFRGVVSPETEGCAELISLGADLDEDARWTVARERKVSRKANELAAVLEPLVCHAREVIFVDPNFSPDTAKWRKPLVELLRRANCGKRLGRCEFHLRAKTTDEYFVQALEDKLAPHLPEDSFVVFVRWKQRQGGEDLHPRYVLTEFGGARVDFGLDEGDQGEFTDVALLDRPTWEQRRADFSIGGVTFDPVGSPMKASRARDGGVKVEVLARSPARGPASRALG
jgi:hypothetical protein